jgi:hypothetical protein
MLTEAQQVAIIQTLLYFVGHQQYAPTAAQIQSQLQAFNQQAAGGSSGGSDNKNPGGWDIGKNQKV